MIITKKAWCSVNTFKGTKKYQWKRGWSRLFFKKKVSNDFVFTIFDYELSDKSAGNCCNLYDPIYKYLYIHSVTMLTKFMSLPLEICLLPLEFGSNLFFNVTQLFLLRNLPLAEAQQYWLVGREPLVSTI